MGREATMTPTWPVLLHVCPHFLPCTSGVPKKSLPTQIPVQADGLKTQTNLRHEQILGMRLQRW